MMKNKRFQITAIVFLLLGALSITINFASKTTAVGESGLLKIKADKTNIQLGELIRLEFEFNNKNSSSIQIPTRGVMSGNIRVFIAKDDGEYRRYVTSGWGRLKERIKILEPNQTHSIVDDRATVLWNAKPNYSHLNKEAAIDADKADNLILSDYAFSEVGRYSVKAVSCLIDGENGCSIPIASDPIQITVGNPVGENLDVWREMKDDPQIGRFLQHGENVSFNKSTLEKAARIVERYPNSLYSEILSKNLEKVKNKSGEKINKL